jgi:acyl dehydratase
MPIDVEKVLGTELRETSASWGPDEIALYNLGIGAGVPPDDPGELAYLLEPEPKVLPSYAVLPALGSLFELLHAPGMDVTLAQLLHGEQELEIHERLPSSAEVSTKAAVTDIQDRGKGAIVILEAVTRSVDDDRPFFTNRFSAYFRGEGGFGREEPSRLSEGAPSERRELPDRPPDRVVSCPTLPQQALLYRMSGDRNPLHSDPEFAKKAGFERPILHGLCTFGMACKAVVDGLLDGDPSKVNRLSARFAGIVYPGETIEVSLWESGSDVDLVARCVERDTPVLTDGLVVTG